MKKNILLILLLITNLLFGRKESDTLRLLPFNRTVDKEYVSYEENGYRIYFPFEEFRLKLLLEIKDETNSEIINLVDHLIAKVQSRMRLFGIEDCIDLKYLENFYELFAARPELSPKNISIQLIQCGQANISDPNGISIEAVIVKSKVGNRKEILEIRTTDRELILDVKLRTTSHKK